MSKGSNPRPFSVSADTFASNFDAVFGAQKKACRKCGVEQPAAEFRSHAYGRRHDCKSCESVASAEKYSRLSDEERAARSARSRAWAEKHPERAKEASTKHVEANRDKYRELTRKRRGLPEPSRPQAAACEMCGGPPNGKGVFHLDHCHETGAFRGWLCSKCNLGLGLLGDKLPAILARVTHYMSLVSGSANDEVTIFRKDAGAKDGPTIEGAKASASSITEADRDGGQGTAQDGRASEGNA